MPKRRQRLQKSWKRYPKASYPIDVVVLFVENDSFHRKFRKIAEGRQRSSGFDNHVTRFRSNNEIVYCMRSIYWCLPWVRTIHLVVADYQFPYRCVDKNLSKKTPSGPQVRIVKHSSFMNSVNLPTFNSQALEANLHKIPNLAEHFIYFNDDFFVGRPLPACYFFSTEKGLPRYNLDSSYVPHRAKTRNMSQHANAWCNNSRLLDLTFGKSRRPRKYPSHNAVPMLKSTWKRVLQYSRICKKSMDRTSSSRFRTHKNLYFIGLAVYWNMCTKRGQARRTNKTLFHDLEPGDDVSSLFSHISRHQPPLYCINDCGYGGRERNVFCKTQEKMFPLKCPWESKVNS